MNVVKSTTAAPEAGGAVPDAGRRLHGHARLVTGAVLAALVVAGGTAALLQDGHPAHRSTGPSLAGSVGSVGSGSAAVKRQRLDQQLDVRTADAHPEDLLSQIHAVTGTSPHATQARTRLYQELSASR